MPLLSPYSSFISTSESLLLGPWKFSLSLYVLTLAMILHSQYFNHEHATSFMPHNFIAGKSDMVVCICAWYTFTDSLNPFKYFIIITSIRRFIWKSTYVQNFLVSFTTKSNPQGRVSNTFCTDWRVLWITFIYFIDIFRDDLIGLDWRGGFYFLTITLFPHMVGLSHKYFRGFSSASF